MAKQKPPKMKPADAVKVLANEMQQTKTLISQMLQDLTQLRGFVQEVAKVMECYVLFNKDETTFSKYMEDLVKEQNAKKEQKKDDKIGNAGSDEENSEGNRPNKRQRAEGVRA